MQNYNLKNKFITLSVFPCLLMILSGTAVGNDSDILDEMIGELLVKADINTGSDPVLEILSDKSVVKLEADKNTEKVPSDDFMESAAAKSTKTNELSRQLRVSALGALPENKETTINSQLNDVLAQLKSLDFVEKEDEKAGQDKPQEAVVTPELVPDEASVIIVSDVKAQKAESSIDFSTLNDAEVIDVFSLAESLFNAGDQENALEYYRRAMAKCVYTRDVANPQRAWILFQIGNCLYNSDRQAAINAYRQLMDEHKKSNWIGLARTKMQILEWLETEKPAELIKSS